MRIQFRTEGGIAYFPGLSKPATIDTNELPAKEANELEQLIEAADFFDLPADFAPPRGAADYRQYTISVTALGHTHTTRLVDPIEDPNVQALVDYLEVKARELRMS
jgi:hypothetical protein